MSRFKAVCNTGIEKDYYTFDGGWHTIKHPGYYITQYMRATGKTTREMTQWVKTSDTPGGHTYAKMARKDLEDFGITVVSGEKVVELKGQDGAVCQVVTDKRVGIAYATPEDQDRLWRFRMVK